ncbi:hypothetical protein CDAR_127371 [Caerostris darwini]|uniref:Uncharacterized protein n=1 Tax=Caerostris darwini TaxID=1538125 RepID=A0AAV4SKT3_9ARAC|nr:hypothetical protein CDAR_127371 [Caerostris darwini]
MQGWGWRFPALLPHEAQRPSLIDIEIWYIFQTKYSEDRVKKTTTQAVEWGPLAFPGSHPEKMVDGFWENGSNYLSLGHTDPYVDTGSHIHKSERKKLKTWHPLVGEVSIQSFATFTPFFFPQQFSAH